MMWAAKGIRPGPSMKSLYKGAPYLEQLDLEGLLSILFASIVPPRFFWHTYFSVAAVGADPTPWKRSHTL